MDDKPTEPPRPKRLITMRYWLIAVPAVLVGASLNAIGEYREAGSVGTDTLVITAITACVGIAIAIGVAWWGNRPEPGDGK